MDDDVEVPTNDDDSSSTLLSKVVRGILGTVGSLLGLGVVVGSFMVRGFVADVGGSNPSVNGESMVFVTIGGVIALLCPVAAIRPNPLTVGLAVLSVLALVVAANLL